MLLLAVAAYASIEADSLVSQLDSQRIRTLFADVQARLDSLQADNQARVDALQASERELRRRVDTLQALVHALHETENATRRPTGGGVSAPHGTTITAQGTQSGRRLTGSSTYLGFNALQIHEFPSGHTCANTAFVESQPMLLGVDGSGPSLRGRKNLASADVSVASVSAKDCTVSEIQRMAAPLKVVHAADCGSSPTLEIALDANFAGTLSVGGVAVSGADPDGSWNYLLFYGGNQATYHDEQAYYTKIGGMVCMTGSIKKTSASALATGDFLATLPVGYRPCARAFIPGAFGCFHCTEFLPGTFWVDIYGNVIVGNAPAPYADQFGIVQTPRVGYLNGACFRACPPGGG